MQSWEKRIRRYRLVHGLTQAQFAEFIGVEQATISRWERGRQLPDISMRRRLSELLEDESTAEDLRLIHMVRNAPHPICLIKQDLTFVTASDVLARKIGFEADEIEGRSYKDYATADILDAFELAEESGFFDGDVASLTRVGRAQLNGGGLQHFLARWVPFRLSDMTFVALVSAAFVARDEYERQRAKLGAVRIVTMADLVGSDDLG